MSSATCLAVDAVSHMSSEFVLHLCFALFCETHGPAHAPSMPCCGRGRHTAASSPHQAAADGHPRWCAATKFLCFNAECVLLRTAVVIAIHSGWNLSGDVQRRSFPVLVVQREPRLGADVRAAAAQWTDPASAYCGAKSVGGQSGWMEWGTAGSTGGGWGREVVAEAAFMVTAARPKCGRPRQRRPRAHL